MTAHRKNIAVRTTAVADDPGQGCLTPNQTPPHLYRSQSQREAWLGEVARIYKHSFSYRSHNRSHPVASLQRRIDEPNGELAPNVHSSFVVMSREAKTTIAVGSQATTVDWDVLYAEYGTDLLAFLRRAIGEPGAAEDLLQETFARAVQVGSRFPVDAARPWLFRVATNLAISHLRRRRLMSFLPFAIEHASGDATFDVEGAQVRAALRSIPADQAVTLVLALHQGFNRREIALMQGVSEEAVKSRLARGRRNFAAAYRRLERGLAR
jgi:RNA polymerase sigma-70 factor, ECF subfamily